MNVTIDLAKKHLQDMPENSDVLKADLIKIIAAYEALEQQLKTAIYKMLAVVLLQKKT